MSFRAVAALALLLLALAAERCGYFAARSVLLIDLRDHGFTGLEASNLHSAITFVAYGAAFGGGGLAFAFGPRVTATIGATVAALGAFALAAGAPVASFSFVLAVGAGIFKACPYAAAAEILTDEDGGGAAQGFFPTPRRFASVATFAVLAYGAVNLGGFIAPILSGVLRGARDGGGFATTYAFSGAVDLVAAVLSGISIFLGTRAASRLSETAHAPYRSGDAPAPSPAPLPASTNDVFVPLTLIGVAFAAMHFVIDHAQPDALVMNLPRASWIFSINPIVVLLLVVPCAVLFFVLAIQRSAIPLTRILGAGMAVFAFGGLLGALALFTLGGLAVWTPALVFMAIGEAIAFPIGLTYAALARRSRAATMVVAGWVTLTALPNFYFGLSSHRERLPSIEGIIVVLSALVALAGAVFVLVKAAQLHRDLSGHSNATS